MSCLPMGRSEINLVRLIAQCEEMVAFEKRLEEWRIKKYIEKLDELLTSATQSARRPDDDKLREYQKKIGFLKDFTSSKNLTSVVDKAIANQRLAPSSTPTISSAITSPTGRQIRQTAASKYSKQMKEELFAKEVPNRNEGGNLRQRTSAATSSDSETMLRHQQEQHELIAEEIISLTRNLKHNITVSGKIIKDDTAMLKDASKRAETNVTKLKHESTRLETHLRKGTNWWLWIAIAVVCFTFLFMIFFIRFFPKSR